MYVGAELQALNTVFITVSTPFHHRFMTSAEQKPAGVRSQSKIKQQPGWQQLM